MQRTWRKDEDTGEAESVTEPVRLRRGLPNRIRPRVLEWFSVESRGFMRIATRIAVTAALAVSGLLALAELSARAADVDDSRAQTASNAATPAQAVSETAPPCEMSGKNEFTITCDYTEATQSAKNRKGEPRIVLNHAALSFEMKHPSHVLVELTFTNGGTEPISEARTVYLAIDDDDGHNYVRRALSQIDFRRLAPGQRLTFTDKLLAVAFLPGRYTIHLWIPNPDPSLKFDSAHDLLLDSAGVANAATGLNTLGKFTVER